MHRLIVALLAAFDAVVATAVGIAATLAPLTLLWIFGFGGAAPWSVLWPASVSVWQLGNLVPLHLALPPEYLAATGIGADAASFVLSLAPLAFATFTAIFAARSGARASRADAWITGVVVGALVFAGLTTALAVTARNGLAAVHLWQAVLFPVLVYAVPLGVGAVVTEWNEAGAGFVARLRDRVEAAPGGWGVVPGIIVRGSAAALAGIVGTGALVAAVGLMAGGSRIVALFEAGNVDLVGVVVVGLGQLAYLPTLVVWGLSFAVGPGFGLGTGTAVSPSGTQLGVVPGIPVLGALPESTSSWMLLVVLIPVGVGAIAGWIARSRFVAVVRAQDSAATAPHGHAAASAAQEPVAPRLVIAVGVAIVTAAVAALLALTASGSMGPGRLAEVGPEPGPVALAVAVEVLVGASILLLSPRRAGRAADEAASSDEANRAEEAAAPSAGREQDVETDASARGVRTPPAAPPAAPIVPRSFARPDAVAPIAPVVAAAPLAEPDAVTAPIDLPGTADAQEPPVE